MVLWHGGEEARRCRTWASVSGRRAAAWGKSRSSGKGVGTRAQSADAKVLSAVVGKGRKRTYCCQNA